MRFISRQQLLWIIAVPLMAAGTVVAHSVTAVVSSGHAETGNEGAERTSAGAPAHVTLLLGFTLALVVVWLGRRLLARRRGEPSAAWFLILPPLAFLFAEVAERVLRSESFPFQPSLEPRLVVGLALQVPFGLVAYGVARLLLRAIERVVARLARTVSPRLRAATTRVAPVSVVLPRIPALALGYQERGPPAHR